MNIIDYLLPIDETEEAVRSYRLRTSIVAYLTSAVMVFVVLPLLLGVPFSFPVGEIAYASQVDHKIEQKFGEVQEQLTNMNKTMLRLMDQQRSDRANALDKDIIDSHKNWCDGQKAGQRATAWAARVRDLMKEYKAVTKEEFDLPSCDRV